MTESRGFPEVPSDRYRIEREVARGGMATVYLAHDLRHDRSVAIKVMHPEIAMAMGRERFLREIKLAAKLSHPNILTVHDSGESGGCLWYVMPYVEGETLRERISKEGRLQVHDVLRLMHESTEAIGYAHSLGVVHRDIKPENILLSRGHAMIADFGVARAMDAARDDHLTASGVAIGTTSYMSPEQATGEHIDATSDVWALGCVMFEMLSGSPPFGTGGREVVTRILTGKRSALPDVRPPITREVEAIVDKALANDKHDRFQTATQFAEAIENVHTSSVKVITARYVGDRRARRAAYVALAIVLFSAIVTFIASRDNDSKAVASPPREQPKTEAVLPDSVRDLIRQARAEDGRRTTVGSTNAIGLYRRAIAAEPAAADAWAELARATDFAYTRGYHIEGMSKDSLLSLSLASSERAVALNPDNANSWVVKGRASRLLDPTDMNPVLFAFEKAVAIDSMHPTVWFEIATAKQDLLDWDGSYAARRKHSDQHPEDVQNLSFLGLYCLWTRKYQEGIRWADSAIKLDPTFRLAREAKGQLLVELGQPAQAVRQFEVALRATSAIEHANTLGLIAIAYGTSGDRAKAHDYANRALALFDPKSPPRHEAVWVGAGLAAAGDTAAAVRLMEAYQPRADLHFQMHLKWDPRLEWLRGKWGKNLLLPDPVRAAR